MTKIAGSNKCITVDPWLSDPQYVDLCLSKIDLIVVLECFELLSILVTE